MRPRCERPSLVVPVRLDPLGLWGPTRQQARGSAWRSPSHGWHVPSSVDGEVVEQRILEQATRLHPGGAVTAWAALRWQGARFFDGTESGGRVRLPVPLHCGPRGNLRKGPDAAVIRGLLDAEDCLVVAGLPCTTPTRAVFDEIVRRGRLRPAVIAVDMACAAGLMTVEELTLNLWRRIAWTGVPLARKVVVLAIDHSRSPQESRLRLIWVIDAGFPPPLCNRAVFDLQGNLLGYPDLLDEEAGMIGEYDGAHHRDADQHRSDTERAAMFRDHGLEYATFVGPDLDDLGRVVQRLQRTRGRALFLPPEQRSWTLEPPPGWDRPLHL